MPHTLPNPVMRRMSPTTAVWTARYHLLMQLIQNVLLLCLKLVLQVHLFRVHLVALKVELRQLQCKATSVHMIYGIQLCSFAKNKRDIRLWFSWKHQLA